MSISIKEVYDAFLDAGSSESKATAATKALASYDERFNEVGDRFNKIEAQLRLIK